MRLQVLFYGGHIFMLGRILFLVFVAKICFGQVVGDTLVYDTFTDTDGTVLTSHTLNTGQIWLAEQSPNIKILSNQAEAYAGGSGTSAYYNYVTLSQKSNYCVKMRWQGNDAAGDLFYIIVRAVNTDSNYFAVYNETSNVFQLGIRAGVSSGTLRSFSYIHDTSVWYRSEGECVGDTLRAWLYDDDQDTLIVALNDTIDSTVQGYGVGLNVYGGNLSTEHADDFIVINILTVAVRRRGQARNIVW